jgi:hypothetical protein
MIILNTLIVIYDFWRLSVLLSSTPSMPIFENRHRQKACLLTNTRMIYTHMFAETHFSFGQFTHEEYVSMDATSLRKLLQRGATRIKQTDVKQP